MLQYLFVIGTFCIAQNWAQAVHNVELKRGEPYDIRNPGYPEQGVGWGNSISIEWNFQVEAGQVVKLICDDIRMVQDGPWKEGECPHVYLSATDGKGERKVCGSAVYTFRHKSDGSNLKLKAVSDGKGMALFYCRALNVGEPKAEEKVRLEPNGKPWRHTFLITADQPQPFLDKVWEFESVPGTRLSFQCDLGLPNGNPDCGFSVLTYTEDGTPKEICTFDYLVWFSKGTNAKLRIQLGQEGHRWMDCLVQAVTGEHPDEFENVVSVEVDSSEHGVTAGAKQTSCKCGWRNHNKARIIHGEETAVNEFPWMVYINTFHENAEGGYSSFCGASIITTRHILTAAHCIVSGTTVAKPQNIDITLGKHDEKRPTGNEVSMKAEKVFIGERYLEKGLSHDDIAVLFTEKTIEFSQIIGPVCIDPVEPELLHKNVIIMGWGLTEKNVFSSYLKKGKSRVMHNVVCNGNAWDVCTSGRKDSICSGDSGSPLVLLDPETNRYNEVSLVSRSSSCVGKYSFTTLISYYYKWIQDIIKATDPALNTCHKV